jgi:NAD-dependent DNA ligase
MGKAMNTKTSHSCFAFPTLHCYSAKCLLRRSSFGYDTALLKLRSAEQRGRKHLLRSTSTPPLHYYASRDAMDSDGPGDETARDLAEKGLAEDIADLYRLSVDATLKLE